MSHPQGEDEMATWRAIPEPIGYTQGWRGDVQRVLASPSVHTLTKDTLRAALTKDLVDAYYDVKLVADLLKARMDAELGRA